MDALRKLQHEFLGYLLDDSTTEIVQRVESTPKRSASQRLALYSNAYTLRLKEALCTDHEILHQYLGDDLFDELMKNYIEQYPSHHPSLRYFSQSILKFLEQSETFTQWPAVIEIAKIEQAFNNSFDACDTLPVSQADLLTLTPESWTTLTLELNDSVQLLPLQFNSFPIWRALTEETTPPEILAEESVWLIWRYDLISRYRHLGEAEVAALQTVLKGGNFADMCSALLTYFDEQETPLQAVGYLQQWVNDQMVAALSA